ncbi:DDE superfamily endonuclease domain [Phytophthora cactorum]|nr:DDE superfamily endonuclease domain [Phytophthora cactorum]
MDCSPTRALQHVVAIRDREKVVEWMAAQALLHGEKGLAGKAVDEFPSLFRSNDRRRLVGKRPAENDDETVDSKPLKYARIPDQICARTGPKLGEHSSWLYPTLLTEFERLRKAGVKMSTRLLQVVAIALIEESQHPIFNKAFCFNDREFRRLVTPRRLQDFTDRFNIVYRRLKGKKQVGKESQCASYSEVAAMHGSCAQCSNYPIQGLPDNVDGVAYCSSPTAFINNSIMQQWLGEVRCWGPGGPFAGERTLWMDNASGHIGDGVVKDARELRKRVRFFPPNATDLVQPAERFPIQCIKAHWRLCVSSATYKLFNEESGAKARGLG